MIILITIKGNTFNIYNYLDWWLKSKNEIIEIWSDCLSYDWVLFCQLFNGALNLPNYIYYIPFDICTMFKLNDIDPDINREEFVNDMVYDIPNGTSKLLSNKLNKQHNSLWDAFIIKKCYEKMMK